MQTTASSISAIQYNRALGSVTENQIRSRTMYVQRRSCERIVRYRARTKNESAKDDSVILIISFERISSIEFGSSAEKGHEEER